MIPRLKLIQCLTCKNSLDCWGLKEDIPLGISEHEHALTSEALEILINEVGKEQELSMGEQFGIFSMMFLQEMRFDKKIVKRDVYQLINMLAALANSANDGWVCPGEDPKSNESFIYEARS